MKRILLCILGMVTGLQAHMMVTHITNDTDIIFRVAQSAQFIECGVQGSFQEFVPARAQYDTAIMLMYSNPLLQLEPVGYKEPASGVIYYFMQDDTLNKQELERAFQSWAMSVKRQLYTGAHDWLTHFVHGTITLSKKFIEFSYGHTQQMLIANNAFMYADYGFDSVGVFGKKNWHIVLRQDSKKGIIPSLQVVHGQGGLCQVGKTYNA